MYELNPGGLIWLASGKFKGGPHSGWSEGWFAICVAHIAASRDRVAECAGGYWPRRKYVTGWKHPMAKWIFKRLLSVHAVCPFRSRTRVVHWPANMWRTRSAGALAVTWLKRRDGWVWWEKMEGFSSKEVFHKKERVLEDADEMDTFFFGIEWYWNLDPSFWSIESQRHTMILTELPSWFFSTHLLNNKKNRRFFCLSQKIADQKLPGPRTGWGYSLVNGRCTCEGDSLHDGLSSVCSYDASHVCSSDSSAGSTSTSTTLMGPVGEWVATGQCLSDIPDFWMSCGYVFQLQCASKTSYPVRGAIFWAPNPANTCSLPSTCNDVGDFLCCPEESWEPCLLYDWTAVGVVFLVILLLLMLLGGNRSVFLVSYLPILFFSSLHLSHGIFFVTNEWLFVTFPSMGTFESNNNKNHHVPQKLCLRKISFFFFFLASSIEEMRFFLDQKFFKPWGWWLLQVACCWGVTSVWKSSLTWHFSGNRRIGWVFVVKPNKKSPVFPPPKKRFSAKKSRLGRDPLLNWKQMFVFIPDFYFSWFFFLKHSFWKNDGWKMFNFRGVNGLWSLGSKFVFYHVSRHRSFCW